MRGFWGMLYYNYEKEPGTPKLVLVVTINLGPYMTWVDASLGGLGFERDLCSGLI